METCKTQVKMWVLYLAAKNDVKRRSLLLVRKRFKKYPYQMHYIEEKEMGIVQMLEKTMLKTV
jgi:hypothetical protein